MDEIKKRVLKLAEQVADDQGVELFDLELLGRGKLLLRVMIDSEEGVSLNDCESFSRSLEALLDVENPIPASYTLEVSSPGLDRPLRNLEDFKKHIGKLARIITTEKIENQNLFIGRILDVDSDFVKLYVHGRELDIPFEKISKARLEVELKCQKSSATS
jgi:ribosome maturation factor RimP